MAEIHVLPGGLVVRHCVDISERLRPRSNAAFPHIHRERQRQEAPRPARTGAIGNVPFRGTEARLQDQCQVLGQARPGQRKGLLVRRRVDHPRSRSLFVAFLQQHRRRLPITGRSITKKSIIF